MSLTLIKTFFGYTLISVLLSVCCIAGFGQAPTITSFTPTTVCQGSQVTITGADFTGATAVQLGSVAAESFKVVNSTTITATVADNATSGQVKVATPKGEISAAGLTVNLTPQPSLKDVSPLVDIPFTNCDGNTTYELTVKNISTNTELNSVYDIDWGDGTTHFNQKDWASNGTKAHTYPRQGYFTIIYKITTSKGCEKTFKQSFYNGVNPLASFTTTDPTTGLCVPANVNFKIGNWFNNSAGTTYEIDFGDGSQLAQLDHPLNNTNTDQIVPHTYIKSSCPDVDFTAILRAKNGCFTTTYTLDQIVIRQKPKADFKYDPSPACASEPVCFTNETIDGYSGTSCSTNTNFVWDFGDGTTSNQEDPSCHQYTKAGNYTVKLSASNTACGSDGITKTIIVKPNSPPPTVSSSNITYCQNDPATPLSATGTGLLWYTSSTGGVGSTTPPTPNTSTPGTTTYYVSQTISGQCESPRAVITVTVNAKPNPPIVITPVTLCKGVAATPLTATGSGLLWYATASGGTGSATAPTPSTSNINTTYYYVSQTTNNCEGPRAVIEVNVIDKPAAPVVVTPVTYCQNQPASPLTATGSNLLWYTTATGGTGTPVAPTPSTAVPGTTTYYVSQKNYCGESQRVAITVNVIAGPSATIVYTPASLCNSSTAATVPATITGDKTGSFSISPSGLPINSSNGTLSPANAIPNTYTITYTINASGGCSVFKTTTKVTVSGTPNATVNYPEICSSTPSVSPIITGTGGGAFSSDAGLVIDKATGVISPETSTVGTHTVKYSIAASAPCPGFETSADVTITKAPSAAIRYDPSGLCNTSTAPDVDVSFTGDKGGSFSIQPSTGLPIDANTGKLSPAGATPNNYTITYTIKASGGCAAFTTTATVSVSNTPNATVNYPEICSSTPSVSPIITGTGGGTFSSDAGLVIDKTTGVISPATSTIGTHTVKYSIAASPPCPGFETSADVTITKAPSASIKYDPPSLCNTSGAPAVAVSFTGDKGGAFSIQPTGLNIDAATGKLSPAGATPGNYTITYTIKASGGCAVFTTTATVSVSGTPLASIKYPPICSSDGNVPVIITGTLGGAFSSGTGLTIDKTTGAITPSASTPGTYTVKYSIAPSPPCPGFDTSTTVIITRAPSASINYQPSVLCNTIDPSNPPVNVTLTGDKGGSFSVQPSAGLLINASSGTITPAGAVPGIYAIIYTLKGTGGCKDFPAKTTVTIQSTPTAKILYPGSPYCGSSVSATVTFTGTPGGVFSSSAGLSIDVNTGTVNPSLSTPGIYKVTYTIAPSPPCPGFIATANVEIAESPVISFTVSSQAVCSKETAVFKPTSTVSNTVYAWAVEGALPPTISGVTSGTVSDPNAAINLLFTNTGTTSETITIKVTPTNPAQNPCGGNPSTLTLTVNPIPAALKADTTEICMHSPPVMLAANPDAGNTVKWYDANNNPLSQAPLINTDNPAQYIFYATQVSGSGCESPKAKFIAIVHPVAKIISSSYTNPTSCGIPSGSITLQVVDLNGNQLPNIPVLIHYTKFQTPLTMKSTTDATGKIVMPLTAGTYSDIYVETYGCLSQKIPNVFVLKDPTPPAQPISGYNAPLCSESILNLSASSPTSSIPGPINYIWVGPAFGNSQDTTQNTVVSFPSASMSYNGTYIVYAMQNNCISPATSFQVVIKQSPSKPVINTKTPLCIGDALNLQAFSSIPGNGTLNFTWNGPGAGFPVNASNAGIQNVKITDGGVYTVSVTSPETGCTVSTDTLIQIGGYPIVKFSKDSLNVATGYVFQLTPTIVNASDPNILPISKYEWAPSQNITCNDAACSNPTITVKNNICYNVKATNIYGCSGGDTICISTFCKNSQVFIPNAFTPNGLAENSIFMVRASGIASIKSFRVFNRWGRVVFEKNNFAPNDPAYGWDGIVNGKQADMGVYIYTVEVICENGTPYSYKGNVTLIR